MKVLRGLIEWTEKNNVSLFQLAQALWNVGIELLDAELALIVLGESIAPTYIREALTRVTGLNWGELEEAENGKENM